MFYLQKPEGMEEMVVVVVFEFLASESNINYQNIPDSSK